MQRLLMIAGIAIFMTAPPVFSQEQAQSQDESMSDPAVCLIGEHMDFPEADARTATFLVCRRLRDQGIQVGEPTYDAPDSSTAYRVSLRILGEYILVHLAREMPAGTVVDEHELLLAGIEEMVSAAPRLAEALVNETPISATVDMEHVVEAEAREYRKIPGEFMWRLGIMQAFANNIARPGAEFGWLYETPSYAVGTGIRYTAGSNNEGDKFSFFAWSIGGQYFFNSQNISPYVGGGFAMSWSTREESDESYYDYYWDHDSQNGLGLYIAGGIEALRLSRARLNLELRIDRPFYRVGSGSMVPVSLGIGVAL